MRSNDSLTVSDIKYEKWLSEHTESLVGKTVAITGSTGGLGKQTCRFLASLGANLVLVDRNEERSAAFASKLYELFPTLSIERVRCDLADAESVKEAAVALSSMNIDVFIHNAGAYSIPRSISNSGYDNVFTINFISPYYLIKSLLPKLSERGGRVVVVGSIAHNYSYIDEENVDFRSVRAASKVYGNAKRYLMFSLYELFKSERGASLSVVHPGISFTGITAHYLKLIFAIIKYPMKVIFMKPKKACLSIIKGVFCNTGAYEWIGPRIFGIWGMPKKSKLKRRRAGEGEFTYLTAEKIFEEIKNGKENYEA